MAFSAIKIYANVTSGGYATKRYSVIPPSPEVASMMKYIDIPVSHFTGQPNIDIPIYTLTEGSLSVPVSLSYKGGGIKHNELSGIISKGWTLMAGMTISRSVHGLPDECNRGQSTPTWLRGLFHLSSSDKTLRNTLINRVGDFDPSEINEERVMSYDECIDYERGYVDFANDIYKFYGQGMSGTFIFDENKQITMSTGSPIKLTSNIGWNYCNYIMIDKERTTYTFGLDGVETTETPINAEGYNLNIEIEDNMEKLVYPSAWHITQMKSLYGDVIDFIYSEPIYRNDYLGATQYYTYYNGGYWCYLTDRTGTSAIRHKYKERSLLAIKGKTTTIKFHYNSSKTQLESISIHKNNTDTTELWRYQILRDNVGNMIQINQIGGSKTQELYRFTYNPKTCTNQYAIDHWGYCNGANNSFTILPEVSGWEHIPYKKADREPNENHTKEGILTSIKYPMGGTTYLNWEPNDYSYIKKEHLLLREENATIKDVKTSYLIDMIRPNISKHKSTGTFDMVFNGSIKISLATYYGTLADVGAPFFYREEFYDDYSDVTHNADFPCVKVIKMEDNGTETTVETIYLDSRCKTDSVRYIGTYEGRYYVKLCNVEPENFRDAEDVYREFYETELGGTPLHGYITVTFTNNVETILPPIRTWGGLRISSMESYPVVGSALKKEYSYRKNINGTTYSTGQIYNIPKYSYQGGAYYKDATIGYEYVNMYGTGSNGLASTTDGEIEIEYGEVWESYSGATNGKLGYFYNTAGMDIEDCLIGGYVPTGLKTLTSYAFKRGMLTAKHYSGFFEEVDNKEHVYKKELYEYSIPEGTCNATYTGPLHTVCDYSEIDYSDGDGNILYKNYTINKFKLIPYNKRIKSESVWEKDVYNNVELENTVTYTYYGEENGYSDKPWNSFVRTKSYQNSRGETVTTYYTYYKIDNIPLELKELEITVVDDIVVSARRNVYGSNHKLEQTFTGCVGMQFSSNFNIPTGILGSATYPEISKKEYSYKYDSQGNIVEIRLNGRVLASYLWGYMGKHPIVEVVGMSYDELFNVAKDYSYMDGFLIDDMNLFLDSFRADKRLAGKEVLTYTYHWLLGMATSTDSRGVTNTYLLDDFGRLSGVKDTNGYYISKYDYKYKGF